jgi:hypothetical protein
MRAVWFWLRLAIVEGGRECWVSDAGGVVKVLLVIDTFLGLLVKDKLVESIGVFPKSLWGEAYCSEVS